MVWPLSNSEVKQSGPLPELADSTATPLSAAAHWATDLQAPSLGWTCTTGGSYWEAFVGRKLEVDVAMAERQDNRELVLRAGQTSASSHSERTVCLWVKCLTTTILELLNILWHGDNCQSSCCVWEDCQCCIPSWKTEWIKKTEELKDNHFLER